MQQQNPDNPAGEPRMHRRQITMEDGRYMIFYTFGPQTSGAGETSADAAGTNATSMDAPAVPPRTPDTEAGEERHV